MMGRTKGWALSCSIACSIASTWYATAWASDAGCVTGTSCSTNDDCAANTRCVLAVQRCADSSDGQDACAGSGSCVVSWQAACQTANDCGGGFDCVDSGRLDCDCSATVGAGEAADGATILSCSAIQVPPECEAGGECVAGTPPCDGGTCVCQAVNVCVQAADFACAGGGACPDNWECDLAGVCLPPCLGSTDAGVASAYPQDAAIGAGYPLVASSCHCDLARGAPLRNRRAWLLGLVVVFIALRARRSADAPASARASHGPS